MKTFYRLWLLKRAASGIALAVGVVGHLIVEHAGEAELTTTWNNAIDNFVKSTEKRSARRVEALNGFKVLPARSDETSTQ